MSVLSISDRAKQVPVSPIRKLTALADAAKKRGIKIYHLNIGQPDLPTPSAFLHKIRNYKEKTVAYAPANGRPELVEAWQKFYASKGFGFDKKNIVVTAGGAEAIIFALLALCDPGDEVIVFEPFYTSYAMFAAMLDVNLVPVTLSLEDGFHITSAKAIERKITNRTKAILFCNPNNPTGTVYVRKELEMLVDIIKRHKIFLLSDETYQEIVFDNKKAIPLSQFPKIEQQIVIVDSLSKRLNICGARLGCIASSNADVMTAITRFAQARLSVGTIEQHAIAAFFLRSSAYIKKITTEYERRRNTLVEGLKKIPGVRFTQPEGAFYTIVGLPVSNADAFARYLLTDFSDRNETVMVAPANGFYKTTGLGENEVRIAYVLDRNKLKRAMELLKIAIANFNRKIGA